MQRDRDTQRPLVPERVLAGGFLLAIVLGGLILSLPACGADGKGVGLLNACFTATSAVCVTGLTVVDTAGAFSLVGQCVLLVLIQLGGLGFMIFATLVMAAFGRRITLSDRILIRESMNAPKLAGLVQLAKWYSLMAVGIELFGATLLAIRFVPQMGWGKGVFTSIFHAVSAFCNAGFDLMGSFRSLTGYGQDPLVLGTLALMIILGGLGFSVLLEIMHHRGRWHELSVHTKLVLTVSLGATLGGTALYALLEWQNPYTLGAEDMNAGERLLGAFFQAVTMRTAGFNSVNLTEMTGASKLVSVLLMFMGASPASTGGGVKTTTVSVLVLLVWSVLRGSDEVNAFGRRLPVELLRRAIAILVITLGALLASTVVIAAMEPSVSLADVLMEVTSAVTTTGVSSAGTPGLSQGSRMLLMILMFLGRVGPLTLGMALYNRQGKGKNAVKYPEAKIIIG